MIPNAVVDQCFAMEEALDKTTVAELPDRATVIVIEWVQTQRPKAESFTELRSQLLTQLTALRWQAAVANWLDPDQIRARNGFALVSR